MVRRKMKCEIITTKIEIEGKEVSVYGLDFYRGVDKRPFKSVKNIFVELKMAESLKDLISNNDVDEIHINDIIEDSLD